MKCKKATFFLLTVCLSIFIYDKYTKHETDTTLPKEVEETIKYKEKEAQFYKILKINHDNSVTSELLENNLWVRDGGKVFITFNEGACSVDTYYSRNNKVNNAKGNYQIDDKGQYKEELVVNNVKVINKYDIKWEKEYLLFVPSDDMPEKENRSFKLYPAKMN